MIRHSKGTRDNEGHGQDLGTFVRTEQILLPTLELCNTRRWPVFLSKTKDITAIVIGPAPWARAWAWDPAGTWLHGRRRWRQKNFRLGRRDLEMRRRPKAARGRNKCSVYIACAIRMIYVLIIVLVLCISFLNCVSTCCL